MRKKNPFGKSRKQENPYAVYVGPAGFEWRVLKVYKHPDNESGPYYRWFISAKSNMTFGNYELGDAYGTEILEFGHLISCDPEWLEHYKSRSRMHPDFKVHQ